jgi:hypothetical protein
MPQPNFEYKKALALGDEAFQSLMTTKIVELVPDAEANWTNYTLFLNTTDRQHAKSNQLPCFHLWYG